MTREDLERDEIWKKARAEERRRLAAYLHDHIGQTLCLTKLQLTRMRHTLDGSMDPAKQAGCKAPSIRYCLNLKPPWKRSERKCFVFTLLI